MMCTAVRAFKVEQLSYPVQVQVLIPFIQQLFNVGALKEIYFFEQCIEW